MHRRILPIAYTVVVQGAGSHTLYPDAYNHLCAAPMGSFIYTSYWRDNADPTITKQISAAANVGLEQMFNYVFDIRQQTAHLLIRLPKADVNPAAHAAGGHQLQAGALDQYIFHLKNWITRSVRTFHSAREVTMDENWATDAVLPATKPNEHTVHTNGGYRLYSRFATLQFERNFTKLIVHNDVNFFNGQTFPMYTMNGALTGVTGWIPWDLFLLRRGVPLANRPVVNHTPTNQGVYTYVQNVATGVFFIEINEIVAGLLCSSKTIDVMIEHIKQRQKSLAYGYMGGEIITANPVRNAVPDLLALFEHHMNPSGGPELATGTAHLPTGPFVMLMDHTGYSDAGDTEHFEFQSSVETLLQTHKSVEFGGNPVNDPADMEHMLVDDKVFNKTRFIDADEFYPR